MKKFLLSLSFLSCLLLASCAGPGKYPFHRVVPPRSSQAEIKHKIVESLKARNALVYGIKGKASVRLEVHGLRIRRDLLLAVKRPSQLRIEALSDLGVENFQWVDSNGDYQLYWPTQNLYAYGTANQDHMEKNFRLSMDPDQLISILTGFVPLDLEEDYELKAPKKNPSNKKESYWTLKGKTSEIKVSQTSMPGDGKSFLPREYRSYRIDGSREYRIEFSDYTEHHGVLFPGHLKARFWDPSSKVEITYEDLQIYSGMHPAIDNKVFRLNIPHDATLTSD